MVAELLLGSLGFISTVNGNPVEILKLGSDGRYWLIWLSHKGVQYWAQANQANIGDSTQEGQSTLFRMQ